ncbi:MAG: hypothetical protein QOI98_2900, partial [Solirubrobacteraceae bacterium]|nr:hypothetical protein [Solirubrobacteraceae bacterium]
GLSIVFGDVEHGHAGLQRTVASWLDAWRSLEFVPEHFVDAGGHVIVWLRFVAEGRESAAPAQMRGAAVYTLENGRVTRIRGFDTLAAAAAAVEI